MKTQTQTQTTQTTDLEGITLPLDLHFTINLYGPEGNAFCIIAMVLNGMRELGLSEELKKKFFNEATSKDYSHLLEVTRKWVHLETI